MKADSTFELQIRESYSLCYSIVIIIHGLEIQLKFHSVRCCLNFSNLFNIYQISQFKNWPRLLAVIVDFLVSIIQTLEKC